MSTLNYLTSGLVQINNPVSGINGITSVVQNNTTSSTTTSTAPADCNIYPVGSTITPQDVIYHDQTILMVNSTVNQNSNTVQAQYFDPVSGAPCPNPWGSSSGFWNYDLQSCSYLNGTMATSSLISDDLTLYSNMQPILNSGTGLHNIDITNYTTNSPIVPPLLASNLFFSLTSNPYYTKNGNTVPASPTASNVSPGYTSTFNSYNFLFVSNYYVAQKNEIIIVELLFTVSNTDATNYNYSGNGSPALSVIVKNKILTTQALGSLSTDSTDLSKVKTYTAGPIPLQFSLPNTTWSSKNFYYSIQNNIPLIIAPGYTKLYATLPLAYVPAGPGGIGYYMNQTCYTISGTPAVPTFNITNGSSTPTPSFSSIAAPSGGINYGHFIVGVAYSIDYNNYKNYSNITAEVLIKNIWRSPIAIYNTYSSFSVADMATKQVVLLFGKNTTGGTFLVLNTGTPVASVTSYAVTSLRNFISIMRAVVNLFNGSVSLVDYFVNLSTVNQVNNMGSYNIDVVIPQPLMDGAIQNPPTINECPGMWYMMLNSKNSFNIAVDPSEQNIFGQQIGFNYLGIPNSILASTGNLVYMQSSLNILSDDQGDLFGNSLSLGLNMINSQAYYILIILPEALFKPQINTAMQNVLTLYSTPNTEFYLMLNQNSGSQFAPSSNNLVASTMIKTTNNQSGSTTTSNTSLQPIYTVQKVILSVSNSKLF
jgi:hypothetical protein